MKHYLTIFAVISTMLFNNGCAPKMKIESTLAYKEKNKIWNSFREAHNYHIQMVGVSKYQNDDSYVVLVAEPPENVTLESFQDLVDDENAYIEVMKHPIGYDGWTKDAVIVLQGLDSLEFEEFNRELHVMLFGSSYKPFYVELPLQVHPSKFLAENLNYKISASELKKWFLEDNEQFYSESIPSVKYNIHDLLSQSNRGVFYSVENGFVVWIIAEQSDITEKKDEIRQYFVDSDILLGAIAQNGNIAFIGREREASILDIPPLRTETIMLLASANKTELAQSYERNSFFAGKLPGGKDWAPIYLSDELLNTEYGGMLNVTDQMLKSWSENGNIQYTKFEYTKPDYFAFNTGALVDLQTSTLTYNWNTKGAVYSVTNENTEIIALNRTGSLPVSYIPEGLDVTDDYKDRVINAEANAYNFFSNLNNVYLIRANEYAAIYQIFSTFQIHSAEKSAMKSKSNIIIKQNLLKILDSLNHYSAFEIRQKLNEVLRKDSLSIMNNVNLTEFEKLIYTFSLQDRIEKQANELDTVKMVLEYISSTYSADGIDKVAGFICNMRKSNSDFSEYNDDILIAANLVLKSKRILEKLFPVDKYKIFNDYFKNYSNLNGQWIKTPSIVLSWSQVDSMFSEGGHNIDSRIVPFRTDRSLKIGEYKIIEENGQKTILIAEKDVNRITPSFLRSVEESKYFGPGNFRKSAVENVIRPRSDVIPPSARADRGLNNSHILVKKLEFGYDVAGKKVDNCRDMIDELVIYAQKEKPEQLKLKFENISVDEANVIVKSTDLKLSSTAKLKSGNIFQVTSHKYDFSDIVIKEVGNGIEVTVPAKVRAYQAGFGISTTNRVKITINNIVTGAKNKTKELLNKIKNSANKEITPGSMDLYESIRKDLIKNGVKPEDILIQRDDCIICQNSYDKYEQCYISGNAAS